MAFWTRLEIAENFLSRGSINKLPFLEVFNLWYGCSAFMKLELKYIFKGIWVVFAIVLYVGRTGPQCQGRFFFVLLQPWFDVLLDSLPVHFLKQIIP